MTSHIRISPSFEELASFLHCGFRCSGSQTNQVIHCLCPIRALPFCFPVSGSHTLISPLLHAEASVLPSGDHAVNKTWFLWPVQVNRGLSVLRSQNRTVLSPEPLAKFLPSGLKLAETTASEWPGRELVHLVTALTRKTAWGW